MLSVSQLQKTYSAEQTIVVLLSRLYFKTITVDEVTFYLNNNSIDWQRLYKIIRTHHIRSFIYHVISVNHINVDDNFKSRLKNDSLNISIQNLHQFGFTKQLLKDLDALGVTAIPYKGVNFGAKYYESVSLRESTDIDLLVDRNSVKRIRQYFHDKQYAVKEDVADGYLNYALLFFKELVFKTSKNSLDVNSSVEIQWRLIDPYIGKFVDFGYFKGQINDDGLNTFNATNDMICMASHHFIREPLTRFKYVIDAACLLTTAGQEIDHALILDLFEKYNYRNFYGVSISTVNHLLGVGLDGSYFQEEHQHNQVLLDSCLAFPPLKKISPLNNPILRLIFDRHNVRGKAALALRMLLYTFIPSANDLNALNLPAFCLPLIIILRPFRFAYAGFLKQTSKS